MDISKMKALTQGMKNINFGNSQNTAAQYDEDDIKYLNEGCNALNEGLTQFGIECLEKASKTIPGASFILFRVYANSNNNSEALKWLEKAAEGGFIDAMIELADLYFDGNVLQKDFAQAFKWCRKAANTTPNKDNHMNDESIQQACFNLAVCYLNGIGTPKNPAEAFSMFKKAGELGSADAMFYIADMYRNGIGVMQSEKNADEWIQKGGCYRKYRLNDCIRQPS